MGTEQHEIIRLELSLDTGRDREKQTFRVEI